MKYFGQAPLNFYLKKASFEGDVFLYVRFFDMIGIDVRLGLDWGFLNV
ncbi:hypothetical protein M9R85_04615 [Psychrobacillus psychrodurans]|nr:hypothetical protein [Psychrobacillus psychrodurans]